MKNFTILGIRLLSLYIFFQALGVLQSFSSLFFYENTNLSDYLQIVFVLVVYTAICMGLYFGANKIAYFMNPPSEFDAIKIDDYQRLTAILFSTVGLFIVYWSFEMLMRSVGSIINLNAMYPDNPNLNSQRILSIIFGGLIQLVAGILLFIGGKKLAKWWNDFRNWT